MLLLLFAFPCILSFAQSSKPMPAELIFRSQMDSIAGEVIKKIQLDPSGGILIVVEAEKMKTSVENAFIDALSKGGFQPLVASEGDLTNPRLRVLVLDESLQLDALQRSGFKRRVSSTVEARLERDHGSNVSMLGQFSREHVDTVAAKDDDVRMGASSGGDFFDRMFGPIIVIAASISIIYLLFTVRS